MIKTARQLKDKIRNLSKSDSNKAQILIRNYAMERFLDRLSRSHYKYSFILKGGMIVSSIIGIDKRSTMDIDTTIRNISLQESTLRTIIEEIAKIDVGDNMSFSIQTVSTIMEDADYPGLRFIMEAQLENTRIPLKIDISTDDVITPDTINYGYKTMFGNQTINLLAYPIETILAEKIESILSKSVYNSRMRDLYDVYMLPLTSEYDSNILKTALKNTAEKRCSYQDILDFEDIINDIRYDEEMQKRWVNYQNAKGYPNRIDWLDLIDSLNSICMDAFEPSHDIEMWQM